MFMNSKRITNILRQAAINTFLLLLTTQVLAQRQTVSGQINGPEGPIPNVSVREVDSNHRVFNHTKADDNGLFSFTVRDAQHSLQFFAPGYRTFTHKMLGQNLFTVTMEPRRVSPFVKDERLVLKSDRLLCGHNHTEEVKQMAWVEQMNDTLFTLVVPVKMDRLVDEYPTGRTLLVLGEWDKILLRLENVVDAYPIDTPPHEVKDFRMSQKYEGTDNMLGNTRDDTPLYAYPHFQFTRADLEYLVANSDAIRRVVVDTYRADNHWNLYPTSQTAKLLQQVLDKAEK